MSASMQVGKNVEFSVKPGQNLSGGAPGSKRDQLTPVDIAIVDPDIAVRSSLTALLTDDRRSIAYYDSAEDFLRALPHSRPACLISEVYLPGMSGIELLQRLDQQGHEIPTILLATRADIQMAVRGIRAGAVEYFEKPYIDAKLRSKVQKLVGRKRHGEDPPG